MTRNSVEVFGQGDDKAHRVALYARVSTGEQQTRPMQLSAMREYAARRGWIVTMEVEEVASGAKHRSARDFILEAASRRDIDIVMVWKLDRWGRSLADLVATLTELHALGVAFISVTDMFDFTTPNGRAMAGMLAVFAGFERDILRNRVKAGIAEARRNGRRHGRPPTSHQHEARVKHLFTSEKMSKRRIAETLGIPRTTVRRLLST